MSYSLKIYTMETAKTLFTYSASTETANFEKEYAADNNLDHGWKPTTAVGSNAIFARSDNVEEAADAYLVWIKNYTGTFLAGDITITKASSPGGPFLNSQSIAIADTTGPIRFAAASESGTHDHWQVTLPATTTIPIIAGFWPLTEFEITEAHEYPQDDVPLYINRAQAGPGGRMFVSAVNGLGFPDVVRSWRRLTQTGYTALLGAHNASSGRLRLVFIDDNGTQYMCRFMSDRPEMAQVIFQHYDCTMRARPVPYIASGDSY